MVALIGALLVGAPLAGCQEEAPPAAPPPVAQVPDLRPQHSTPFVVFLDRELELPVLGEPVDPPVTVGSRPSPDTMWSDSPGVLSVAPDGRLLAHREGSARIVARNGGPPLDVRVRSSPSPLRAEPERPERNVEGALVVQPAHAAIRLGEIQGFQALTTAGPVPADWSSSNEQKVAHLQDHLFQGLEPGQAQVCARANGRRACTTVEVTP
jgi:hypothetical protein